MTRSVKAHEYAEKRNAILDVAERYITTKGYEGPRVLMERDTTIRKF